jgi:hypothetical protein
MFSKLRRALAVLLARVMPGLAVRLLVRGPAEVEARRAQLAAQAAAVLALARPARARQVVVLPPGMPLQLALEQAQQLRAGLVPAELLEVLRPEVLAALHLGPTTGSPRSTASSRRTARSTSKRRRAR